ncbi:MAG: DUF1599 domain-containing protein [Prevotella sp.]|jgi:hypothetical protein|nr:DUF1599 domain-containing protein [Prevotella sp.]
MNKNNTEEQFKDVMNECRALFYDKLHDYGASWRVWRLSTVADQIFIKAKRIRTLEITHEAMIDEGRRPEYIGIINYCIVAMIQLELGYAETLDMSADEVMTYYDKHAQETLQLMIKKNHDYNEAWRSMYVSTYTDFILGRINRVKEILTNEGKTNVSEGLDSQFMDMMNYSVFGAIRLSEKK